MGLVGRSFATDAVFWKIALCIVSHDERRSPPSATHGLSCAGQRLAKKGPLTLTGQAAISCWASHPYNGIRAYLRYLARFGTLCDSKLGYFSHFFGGFSWQNVTTLQRFWCRLPGQPSHLEEIFKRVVYRSRCTRAAIGDNCGVD